ncbi:MAG: heme exporter protein CcmB [Ignavibacteria bacterium]
MKNTKMRDLYRTSLLIFKKDIRSELRTRYVINSLVMFVLIIISIIKFSLGEEIVDDEILTGLLWIAIFFSASNGLSRTFVKEEDKETSAALKLSADPSAIIIGKMIFNLFLSYAINILIITLFVLITDYHVKNISGFILIIFIGNLGLVSASTIIAAIISKANNKGTLYPVLSFPILLPLIVTAVNATKLASIGVSTEKLMGELQILISYSIVVITASLMLFKYIWED